MINSISCKSIEMLRWAFIKKKLFRSIRIDRAFKDTRVSWLSTHMAYLKLVHSFPIKNVCATDLIFTINASISSFQKWIGHRLKSRTCHVFRGCLLHLGAFFHLFQIKRKPKWVPFVWQLFSPVAYSFTSIYFINRTWRRIHFSFSQRCRHFCVAHFIEWKDLRCVFVTALRGEKTTK